MLAALYFYTTGSLEATRISDGLRIKESSLFHAVKEVSEGLGKKEIDQLPNRGSLKDQAELLNFPVTQVTIILTLPKAVIR